MQPGGDVVAAVASLYDDKLKPYGDILHQRLLERATIDGKTPPFIGLDRLRAICQECSRLDVRTEAAGSFSVFLVDQPPLLVDPADPADPYSQLLWDEMRAYFAKDGPGSKTCLPGNRYKCAVALAKLGLRRLREFYLGEVAHVVALAMGSRRILGIRNGRILPFWKCISAAPEDMVRPDGTEGDDAEFSGEHGSSSSADVARATDVDYSLLRTPTVRRREMRHAARARRRERAAREDARLPASGAEIDRARSGSPPRAAAPAGAVASPRMRSSAGSRPATEQPTASGTTHGGAEATASAGSGLVTAPPKATGTAHEGRPAA